MNAQPLTRLDGVIVLINCRETTMNELQWKIWRAVIVRDCCLFKAELAQKELDALYLERDAERIVQLCLTGK